MGAYLWQKIEAAQRLLLGNSLMDWMAAGIVALAVWSALWILRRFTASRYRKYSAAQHPTPIRLIAYLVGNTTQLFILGVALYAAQGSITHSTRSSRAAADHGRAVSATPWRSL